MLASSNSGAIATAYARRDAEAARFAAVQAAAVADLAAVSQEELEALVGESPTP